MSRHAEVRRARAGHAAVGVLAIGRLRVRDARFRRLEVDELVLGRVVRASDR